MDDVFTPIALLIDNPLIFSILVITLAYLSSEKKRPFQYLLYAMSTALILSMILKPLFLVQRPCHLLDSPAYCLPDFSLPSTHAAVAFSLAISLLSTKRFPYALLFASLISYSRVFLGVHSTFDVLASISVALISIFILDLLKFQSPVLTHEKKQTTSKNYDESKRQAIHMLLGLFFFFIWLVYPLLSIGLLSLGLMIGLILFHLKAKGSKILIADIFLEHAERGLTPPGLGALTFFAGISISLLIPDTNIAIATCLLLIIGDSASSLIGTRFGRNRLPYNDKKSVEGTMTFLLIGLIIVSAISYSLFPLVLLATFAESITGHRLDDNLLIPASGLIYLTLF